MNYYMDVLPEGSTAIAVKTKGKKFVIDYDGLSSTGCWVVTKDRITDYVIIFLETKLINYVYIGEFVGKTEEGTTEHRGTKRPKYRIHLKNIKLALETQVKWTKFVGNYNGGFGLKYLKNEIQNKPTLLDPDSYEAEEGYKKDSLRMTSERDKKLAKTRKIKDNFTCQACKNQYLVNDKYIIDCHHLNPIYLGERKTSIDDLVSLCPTCHRIAHTRIPPYDLNDLIKFMKK